MFTIWKTLTGFLRKINFKITLENIHQLLLSKKCSQADIKERYTDHMFNLNLLNTNDATAYQKQSVINDKCFFEVLGKVTSS